MRNLGFMLPAVSLLMWGVSPNVQENSEPRVNLRETAIAMARSGISHDDARSVLAAAQLLLTSERRSGGIERVRFIADSGQPAAAWPDTFTTAMLLRAASRIAVDQQDAQSAQLAAEIAGSITLGLGNASLARELRAASRALGGTRGGASGPIWSDGYLPSRQAAEFRLTFEGGYVPNRIDIASSNTASNVECALFEGTLLIVRTAGIGGKCALKWKQRVGGAVTLRVRNAGVPGTYYTILSN